MENKKNIKNIAELDFTADFTEKLFLNKVFYNKEYMVLISSIFDKRWFVSSEIGDIMSLCLAFYKKYDKLLNKTVLNNLVTKFCETTNNDIEKYNSVISECIFSKFDIDETCIKTNIVNYIKTRSTFFAIFDNAQDIEKRNDISKCLKRLEAINTISFDEGLGFNYFNDLAKHEEYIKAPESRLSMGLRWLDEITNGGLLKDGKCLGVFMAQPGLGKSLLLANVAYRLLKQDKTVVIISCEMSENVYGRRIDSLISNDCIDTLQYTYESTFAKIRHFKELHPNATLCIKEYPPRTIRSIDIKLYIDSLIAKGIKPDCIIVDYLNLVLPNNESTGDTTYAKVLQAGENLRALSYIYSCPVLTATQTNSEGINNGDVGLQHTSESRGTGHTGDLILALYQLEDDIENGIINVKILKNRLGGKHGKVHPFKLDAKTLRLDDEMSDAIQMTDNSSNNTNNKKENTTSPDDVIMSLDDLDIKGLG